MFITSIAAAEPLGADFINCEPEDPLIAVAGPGFDSRVAIVSPGALDLACVLLRRGYQTASVVRLDDHVPAHQADVVMIPRPANAASLERAINLARRMLAPMGTVAVRLPLDRPDVIWARHHLLLNGFTAVRVATACGEMLVGAELPLHGRVPFLPRAALPVQAAGQ